jgi:hypothetical protein
MANAELSHAGAIGLGKDHSPVVTPGAEIGKANIPPVAHVVAGATAVPAREVREHPHIAGIAKEVTAAMIGHSVVNTPPLPGSTTPDGAGDVAKAEAKADGALKA